MPLDYSSSGEVGIRVGDSFATRLPHDEHEENGWISSPNNAPLADSTAAGRGGSQ